jgi:hypothetical protein
MSLTEIEDLVPWERDITVKLITQYMKNDAEAQQAQAQGT